MARISLSICDLCKKTIKDDLGRIKISYPELDYDTTKTNDITKDGEICRRCFNNLSTQLNQEIPVFPGAAPSTPSEPVESPDLLSVQKHYIQTGENLGGTLSARDMKILRSGTPNKETGLESTGELLDCEVNVVKSVFTDEMHRKVAADLARKCNHPRGFSMSEDASGIVCKDCGEQARF